ncbi:non-ribosomal peptide synthetase, partial [Myxococcaceae bacterium JPH2]|nr:non-ribosomal peptide synthetase [Myxococcaceae bacterium JPH2]
QPEVSERSHVAPRDEVELALAAIWEELLDVRPVSLHDDFFQLGGHSLLAMRLVARIRERLGRSLPVVALFQSSTLEALAVRVKQVSETSSPLVALHPSGTLRPFFCVHPVSGQAVPYLELARHLGSDQPFYALQSPGLEDGATPLTTVEAMAERYIEALRAVQPSGPYRLGGWSLGGVIAFEMARQLTRLGEQVEQLVLIDAYAGQTRPAESHASGWISERFVEFTQRLLGRPVAIDALQSAYRVFESNLLALWNYVPGKYDGAALLIRASETQLPGLAEDGGWGRYISGPLKVCVITGDHHAVVAAPAAETLAKAIRGAALP